MLTPDPREAVQPWKCAVVTLLREILAENKLSCQLLQRTIAHMYQDAATSTQMCSASSDVPSGSQPPKAAPISHSLSCFFPPVQLVEQFGYVNLASEAEVL